MKRLLNSGLVAGVASAFLFASSLFGADVKTSKTVTLFNLGAMDEAGLSQAVAYLKTNLPLPVNAITLPAQATVDAALQTVGKAKSENDAIIVVVAALKNSQSLALTDADHAIAVVNADAVKKLSKNANCLNFAVMRAIAAELGVGFSIDIHCVNRRIASLTEYEKLGGNFCPPVLQQVLIAAGERGVQTTLPSRKRAAQK